MNIPLTLTMGDSYTWKDFATTDNLGNNVDAPTWTLYYAISGGSATLILTGARDGTSNSWTTSISSAQTMALSAGTYYWQAYVTSGSSRQTLGTGQINILQNVAIAGANYDGRSQFKKDLDAVQAAMRAMITGGAVAEYTIGNRSVRRIPMSDLIVLEAKLKAQVVREERASKIAQGLGDPGSIYVRFK